ncbi:hypothetical protein EDEG_00490 [Edhazardia aedis USNM 41457]|uniref:Transmembrane protein n=1 Tax=Edhazardia aedis (strain USNM 41457) TaxID=1003232 RepID=J9DFF1_EDHAE|nr:hypothetical protein EDEG_00490 [Edhazardia aedis USNM 41457]|eukprot:EJW01330.1 hypothetical protein EDEG_00490 [Edhazardia aedis USNM 41457]
MFHFRGILILNKKIVFLMHTLSQLLQIFFGVTLTFFNIFLKHLLIMLCCQSYFYSYFHDVLFKNLNIFVIFQYFDCSPKNASKKLQILNLKYYLAIVVRRFLIFLVSIVVLKI